jgi:hypothetical protein
MINWINRDYIRSGLSVPILILGVSFCFFSIVNLILINTESEVNSKLNLDGIENEISNSCYKKPESEIFEDIHAYIPSNMETSVSISPILRVENKAHLKYFSLEIIGRFTDNINLIELIEKKEPHFFLLEQIHTTYDVKKKNKTVKSNVVFTFFNCP